MSYLKDVASLLPRGVYEYAAADWHYDPCDHRCPHDAWLENLTIAETSRSQSSQDRDVAIQIKLLGAYHDMHLIYEYSGICDYHIDTPRRSQRGNRAHGDCLLDEIIASGPGIALHEMIFSNGTSISIRFSQFSVRHAAL